MKPLHNERKDVALWDHHNKFGCLIPKYYAKYCRGYTDFSNVHCKLGCLDEANNLPFCSHNPLIAAMGKETLQKAKILCQFLCFQTRKARCTHFPFFHYFQGK